jgi:hypothetical protein
MAFHILELKSNLFFKMSSYLTRIYCKRCGFDFTTKTQLIGHKVFLNGPEKIYHLNYNTNLSRKENIKYTMLDNIICDDNCDIKCTIY